MRIDELITNYVKKHKSVFIIGLFLFVIGLICHGYMFFNKLPNLDEAGSVNGYLGVATPLGRWALPFTGILNGPFSSPALNGSISLLLIILSVFLISDVLNIRSHLAILCMGGVLISFPVITSTFTFMYASVAYMLSLFLEVLAVWLCVCDLSLCQKHPKIRFLLAACIMAGGIGIYQAYYQVACTLILIYGLQSFLKEDKQTVAQNAGKLISLLALSMVIYYIMVKVGCFYTGKEMDAFYTAGSISELIGSIPHSILRCYSYFVSIFISDFRGISFNWIVRIPLLVLVLEGIALYEYLLFCKRKSILLGNFMLLLFPLALGVIRLTMTSRSLDTLIIFSYSLLTVFPFAMLSAADAGLKLKVSNLLWGAALTGCLLLTWQYAILSNNVYTTMDLAKTEAISYYTTMITQIKSTQEYTDDLPICLLGTESNDTTVYDLSDYYKGDVRGTMTCDRFINMYSRHYFLSIYLGYDPAFIDWEDFLQDADDKTCKILEKMPSYPDQGSIRVIDGTIIVKISDDYKEAPVETKKKVLD